MEARRRMEFTGGSGSATLVGDRPVATAVRRGKELTPTRLGEGARSAGEPLVPALPCWSARDWAIGDVAPPCRGPLGPPR
jgi:hypothetical protein